MLTAERDSETAQKAGKVMTMLESSDQTVERRPFDPASFDPEILQGEYQEIANMLLACHCGIKEVRTKLEILSDEMQLQNSRNPIEYIRSRIKTFESIVGKLKRRGLPMTVEAARRELYDIAGVRVVCTFVDDVYRIARMLEMQDDIKVLIIKDYIRNPKPSGYRSYHMIVEVPVFFSNHSESVRVEIQIRTIAMDFWATLEHQLNYKREQPGSEEIVRRLRACADSIANTDQEMQSIRQTLERLSLPVRDQAQGAAGLAASQSQGTDQP